MDIQSNNNTKTCPFCAERIPAAAIKCKHCGEIFTPERMKLVEQVHSQEQAGQEGTESVIEIIPSKWAVVPRAKKAVIVLLAGILLLIIPIEKPFEPKSQPSSDNITINQDTGRQPATGSFYSSFRKFRIVLALLVILIAAAFLAEAAYELAKTSYKITPKRIEYCRGIFSKNIDNIDMFRIIDLKMRQTIFDRMTGMGTVIIYTTDKTDPQFAIENVPNPAQLYDVIKKFSLDADKGGAVVHLE